MHTENRRHKSCLQVHERGTQDACSYVLKCHLSAYKTEHATDSAEFAHPHVSASLRTLRVLSITKRQHLHMLVTRISSMLHPEPSNSSSKLTYFRSPNLLGHAVAQLVEALHYKPEGRGFESRWCRRNFYWHNPSGGESNDKLPQELAQDAVCKSHTGHMTGLWFLPTRLLRLNSNEWMNEYFKQKFPRIWT